MYRIKLNIYWVYIKIILNDVNVINNYLVKGMAATYTVF